MIDKNMLDREKCLRNKNDCQPISNMFSDETFVCVGNIDCESRTLNQDEFRHCFKSYTTDTTYDYDRYDLTSVISVMSKALLYDELRNHSINNEKVEIVTGFGSTVKINYCGETNIFTIKPTEKYFSYYVEGTEITISDKLSVEIPKIKGVYCIYLTKDGTLIASTSSLWHGVLMLEEVEIKY